MKNHFRVVFFVLIVIFSTLLGFLVVKQRHLKQEGSSSTNDQEITLVSSTEVAPINYRSQYIAERLIRGHIQSYDQEQQTLSIRYQVNPKAAEQVIAFPLALEQSVYCWPAYNNGVDISQAFMPIDSQTKIYIQGETAVFFKEIIDQIVGKYVFLQTNEQGELVKLAILACYD
jgi:hypothetical protein